MSAAAMKPMEIRSGAALDAAEKGEPGPGAGAQPLPQRDPADKSSASGSASASASASASGASAASESSAARAAAEFTKIVFGIGAYSVCSSSLLLLNKLAVTFLPSVSFVLLCQFLASMIVVKGLGVLGFVEVDALELEKVRRFSGVSFLFAMCLFTNVKALQYANVETLIVFRSLSPLAVTIADFFFMDLELPSLRSWLSLLSIGAGAGLYVFFDGNFHLESYLWVIAYFLSIVSEMVYVKYVITEVKMTTWGRVYYNNLLSIFPVLLFGWYFGDHLTLAKHDWSQESIVFLALSCVVGVGISYAGFYLRELVTATTFTVVGVVNKLATTVVNLLVWDKHADLYGILALLVCIVGGTFYQPSAPRKR